jgi:hypothetical protein
MPPPFKTVKFYFVDYLDKLYPRTLLYKDSVANTAKMAQVLSNYKKLYRNLITGSDFYL